MWKELQSAGLTDVQSPSGGMKQKQPKQTTPVKSKSDSGARKTNTQPKQDVPSLEQAVKALEKLPTPSTFEQKTEQVSREGVTILKKPQAFEKTNVNGNMQKIDLHQLFGWSETHDPNTKQKAHTVIAEDQMSALFKSLQKKSGEDSKQIMDTPSSSCSEVIPSSGHSVVTSSSGYSVSVPFSSYSVVMPSNVDSVVTPSSGHSESRSKVG